MVMGRQLSLNKSLDSTILKGEAQDKVNEGEKLDELGAKFVSDNLYIGLRHRMIEHR